ncbi:MAG: DUF4157 domain-containing protein [Candidatus Hodarchaeota archaeon]
MSQKSKVAAKTPESKKGNSVSKLPKPNFPHPLNSSVDQILFLQRTTGNQAVQRLIKSGSVHPNLKISQPNDIYEQEADRIAERVLHTPETQVKNQIDSLKASSKTKESPKKTPRTSPDVISRIQTLKGGGQPLSHSTRAFFEPRFGHDLGEVRVHVDTESAESAKGLNARAYTLGKDIVFNEREYTPETSEGHSLLAHELAHVVESSKTSNAENDRVIRCAPLESTKLQETSKPRLGEDMPTGSVESFFVVVEILRIAKELATSDPPDVEIALALVKDVEVWLSAVVTDENIDRHFRGRFLNLQAAEILTKGARSEIQSLRSRLERAGRRGSIKSRATSEGLWNLSINTVVSAGDYLQIMSGDIPFEASPVAVAVEETSKDLGRFVIEMTPVVGSIVMIGEALVGKDIWGRPLSTPERVILGIAGLLAELGTLIRAGKVTTAASRLSKLAGIGHLRALKLVVFSRVLTKSEREAIKALAAEVRAGKVLTEKQVRYVERIVGKVKETERAQAIRAEVAARTGIRHQPGRFTDLGKKNPEEIRVGEILARELDADVIRPPKVKRTTGAKNPDYIVDDVVFELYSPISGSLKDIISNTVGKHKQAGVVVVNLTKARVSTDEFIAQTHKLWEDPRFMDVSRIIVVAGAKIVADLARPPSSLKTLLGIGLRGTAAGATARNEPSE